MLQIFSALLFIGLLLICYTLIYVVTIILVTRGMSEEELDKFFNDINNEAIKRGTDDTIY